MEVGPIDRLAKRPANLLRCVLCDLTLLHILLTGDAPTYSYSITHSLDTLLTVTVVPLSEYLP
jgi:hypothetical protein